MSWKVAFIITQMIEITVGFLLRKTNLIASEKVPSKKTVQLLLLILSASTITHPILWFVLYPWSVELQLSYTTFVVFGEGYVWIVEGLLYKVAKLPYPFILSLLLNTSSYVFGNHVLPLFL